MLACPVFPLVFMWPVFMWPVFPLVFMWPVFMPSLEAARPDILPLVILALEPVALVCAPVCALAPGAADPLSCAQEDVAAAKAIAPTTPSMSGSFITAFFMIAPP